VGADGERKTQCCGAGYQTPKTDGAGKSPILLYGQIHQGTIFCTIEVFWCG